MAERHYVWLTRPLEESKKLGLHLAPRDTLIAPVIDIEPLDTPLPEMPDALLITSKNAAEYLAGVPLSWRTLPVYCVGNATAQAVHEAAFLNTHVDDEGGIMGLLPQLMTLSSGTKLLYLAGTDRKADVAGLLTGRGIHVAVAEVYRAKAITSLPKNVRKALASGDVTGVAFFSPRSARIACKLVAKAGLIECAPSINAYCISLATAEEAGLLGWKSIHVCHAPTQETMVELITSQQPADLL